MAGISDGLEKISQLSHFISYIIDLYNRILSSEDFKISDLAKAVQENDFAFRKKISNLKKKKNLLRNEALKKFLEERYCSSNSNTKVSLPTVSDNSIANIERSTSEVLQDKCTTLSWKLIKAQHKIKAVAIVKKQQNRKICIMRKKRDSYYQLILENLKLKMKIKSNEKQINEVGTRKNQLLQKINTMNQKLEAANKLIESLREQYGKNSCRKSESLKKDS